MSYKKENVEPFEVRLERAEERISCLTCALQKLSLKCSAYEGGLKDIVQSEDLIYIKDKVATLRVIAGGYCVRLKF